MNTGEHDIPILKVLGVMTLCFSFIALSLFVAISWIIRVGKAEHEEKKQRLRDEINKKED
ncbi:hypothetical protein BGZ83_007385 [Gryganskiella cystojenkinii]|nr:hypothetical protein BGZ83_007385 [Gryganskiella cystojenkinii]